MKVPLLTAWAHMAGCKAEYRLRLPGEQRPVSVSLHIRPRRHVAAQVRHAWIAAQTRKMPKSQAVEEPAQGGAKKLVLLAFGHCLQCLLPPGMHCDLHRWQGKQAARRSQRRASEAKSQIQRHCQDQPQQLALALAHVVQPLPSSEHRKRAKCPPAVHTRAQKRQNLRGARHQAPQLAAAQAQPPMRVRSRIQTFTHCRIS